MQPFDLYEYIPLVYSGGVFITMFVIFAMFREIMDMLAGDD